MNKEMVEMEMNEMVAAVKAHALAHYEFRGWDVIVECYDDEMIAEIIANDNRRSAKGAIASVRKVARTIHSVRSDVMATAF